MKSKLMFALHPVVALCCLLLFAGNAISQQAESQPGQGGPYNGSFIANGVGLEKTIPSKDAPLQETSVWSMYCWVRSEGPFPSKTLLAGFGDPKAIGAAQRYLGVIDGDLAFWSTGGSVLSPIHPEPNRWHLLAASYDGASLHLYYDAKEVASQKLKLGTVLPTIMAPYYDVREELESTKIKLGTAFPMMYMAPEGLPWASGGHFAGKIARFTLVSRVITANDLHAMLSQAETLDLTEFEAGSKDWPVQTEGQEGLRAPQDPATLPTSIVPPSKPVIHSIPKVPPLTPINSHEWTLTGGWQLASALDIKSSSLELSRPGAPIGKWMNAIVPGTVLTTLIANGIYPDPDYGLNNLAIPETLNQHDYWYRTQFMPPVALRNQRLTLTFNGINYAAKIWLNGKRLGDIRGAFVRGQFDVTGIAQPGKANVLLVRISPPRHSGIPPEQSIAHSGGPNGGIMCLDGPTFISTEGWGWVPGIRDRDTGLWQNVTLKATGEVKIGDIQVVTTLNLPNTSRADVTISIPLANHGATTVHGVLKVSFEGVDIVKRVAVPPGGTAITLAPAEYPKLSIANPRLWWPNGYGKPELYHLEASFHIRQTESDTKRLHFGIREITYELSLLDGTGHLRRVEYSPTTDRVRNEEVVDVSHEGILKSSEGWVASIRPGEETSPSLRMIDDYRTSPYLVIKVNGVRIAIKGGNWGLDDSRKRVSLKRLEPYIRLSRDAHFTMIRNWAGQNTEEAFYDLCDEYGLLVWNDFWIGTQNYNLEPSNTSLFLNNVRDVLLRYRNHPSIAIWCGRNEGIPPPALDAGMEELIRTLDGTRYYTPSSRLVNLQVSGPWTYGEPVEFFTRRGVGFTTEMGLPSAPAIEPTRAMMPTADQWPPSDTWAYHDWDLVGKPVMTAMEQQLGAATSLEDFERKVQLLNYVSHRALFEGFNAHLWAPNSGRLLWMSQPAWPSMIWQLYSSDYDTFGSYYGAKKACEPIHIQLNLPDLTVAVVNTTRNRLENLSLRARVFSLDGKQVLVRNAKLSVQPDVETEAFPLNLPKELASDLVFIKLELMDANGKMLSENFYWQAAKPAALRKLNDLHQATIQLSVSQKRSGHFMRVTIDLANDGDNIALMNKVTLREKDGAPVLPAYASDNYISLLPHECRRIEVEYPQDLSAGPLNVEAEGWNVRPILKAVME